MFYILICVVRRLRDTIASLDDDDDAPVSLQAMHMHEAAVKRAM